MTSSIAKNCSNVECEAKAGISIDANIAQWNNKKESKVDDPPWTATTYG